MVSRFRSLGWALILCLCAVVVGGASLAAGERPRPSISVESEDRASRLWVDVVLPDGTAQRRLLRETPASVRPTASGWGPEGRAGFTTWEESGARWFSYSRDAGDTWSEARPLSLGLRLRDSEVAPDDRMPDAPGHLTLPPGGGLYLVQFKTISLPEWRAALQGAGAEVLAYFPDNAHVVRLGDAPAARVESLAGLEMVERVEPFHPWYRLSAELRTWLEEPGDAAPERMRVRVVAFEWGPAGKSRIAALAGNLGVEIVELPPNGHVVELNVDREQLVRIATHDDVQWIERWAPPQEMMDLMRQDSGAAWLESNYVSVDDNLGYCGQGVRGEVMDSGIWEAHPDFDPIQFHGSHDAGDHGTSTYGIVFGRGYEDPRGRGVLPCGEGIFATSAPPDRYAHTAQLKQSPYFASFQTNSWGNQSIPNDNSYNSFAQGMDDIIWRLDIAILQAQANSGTDGSAYQAIAKNIISVGGIRHYDTQGTADDAWADGASVGPAQDGRIKPDISYWYDNIYTTDIEPDGYAPDSIYVPNFGGTSAATPEAAGVLGLMLQMWKENVWATDHLPETTVFEAQPHFSTLKALLINNAQQYPFDGEGHDLARYKQGWGRPSVRVAAERAAGSFIADQEVLLEVGELATYRIDVVPGESELKVTMVYPDPPGNPASSMARVNDLDLRLISPSGDVYHGNVGLTAGNASVSGGATNRVDTVENVFVVAPEPGTWSVAVDAVEINQDACPVDHASICGPTAGGTPEADATFSLVVTGGTGGASCTAPTAGFTVTPNPVRVAGAAQFQANVSGGAGGPYSYWWDFDGDGAADSTGENDVHAYPRPGDWSATLWAADRANCSVTVRETVTVTGPDLWYDSYVDLTEIYGNGNGGIDPGETWELTVNLRNDGNEPPVGVSADLALDPESPLSVTLMQASSTYADIGIGELAPSHAPYRFRVGADFPCGEWISFSLTARSTDPANTYPTEVGVIRLLVGATGLAATVYYEDFESPFAPLVWGSDMPGEWQIDIPHGLGGPMPDPNDGFDGPRVMGTDLTGLGLEPGNYEIDSTSYYVSPSFDLSGYAGLNVTYARWLNLGAGDTASFEIRSLDDLDWTTVDSWTWTDAADSSWTMDPPVDISDIADGRERIQFMFRMQSDGQGTASGWNIDAFEVRGVPTDSCEPYTAAVGYDRHSGLTEIDGNGNGWIDPGETWELTVDLRNNGNVPAIGVTADLTVDPATPGSVSLLQNSSDYGTINPGQVVSSLGAYRFRLGDDFPCGGEVVLSVTDIASTDPADSYPDHVAVIRMVAAENVTLFYDGFENETGWVVDNRAGDGEWEFEMPRGLGGPQADPQSAYEGQFVLGNDLTGLGLNPGNAENDVESYVYSPIIDIPPAVVATDITFAHWLNLGLQSFEVATLQVNSDVPGDEKEWVWLAGHTAESWSLDTFDLRDMADGKDWLQVRIMLKTGPWVTNSGWNIDAFEVHGVRADSCENYYTPRVGYDGYSGLTEIDGNGNAVVEPGETWEMSVHLRNDGSIPAGGVSADLTVDPATPGSVFLLQNSSEYGTIDPGQVVASLEAYRFRLGDDFPCGGDVELSVTDITSTDPARSYPHAVGVIRIPVGESGTLFYDGFETETGWTPVNQAGDGEWERDAPRGLGGPQPDPQSAYEGQFVLGNDLTGLGLDPGNYENDVTSWVRSPVIAIPSGFAATDITFAHWLNLADADLAMLQVDVSEDSKFWTWPADHTAESWSVATLDIRDLANGKDWLQTQILLASDAQSTNSGWNIDGFEVRGQSCAAFERALPGEAMQLRVSKGPSGYLTLEWSGDCGAATTYGIYRGDLRVGYDSIVTEPGMCNVTSTVQDIPEGSGGAEFFLVVPHKDGEEGSYGTDSAGAPRPPAVGGCAPQGEVDVCAH